MDTSHDLAGPRLVDMAGRVALITGGSKGIGAGCASALVAAGATVAITARGREAGTQTAEMLNARGPGTCTYTCCDVSDFTALRSLVRSVVKDHGRLDVLVNNVALFSGAEPIDDVDDDLVIRVLAVNVGAYFVAARESLPHLRKTRGSIVNIGSIAGELGGWRGALYAATKGAVMSLTRALAVEEATHGVRVNAVLPGNIRSQARIDGDAALADPEAFRAFTDKLQWMRRSGTIEEVGNAVLFLASEMASYCTGIGLVVSGGIELGVGTKQPPPEFALASSQ